MPGTYWFNHTEIFFDSSCSFCSRQHMVVWAHYPRHPCRLPPPYPNPPCPPVTASEIDRADVLMAEPRPRALPPATAAPVRTGTRLTAAAPTTAAEAGGEAGAWRVGLAETGIDATETAVGTLASGYAIEVGATITKAGVSTGTTIEIEMVAGTVTVVGIEKTTAQVPEIARDNRTGRGGVASAKRGRSRGRPRPSPRAGRGAMIRKERIAVGRREVDPPLP